MAVSQKRASQADGAWIAYTPTLGASTSGAPAGTAAGYYKMLGNKTCAVKIDAGITGAGNASGTPSVSLPFAAKASQNDAFLVGHGGTASSGIMLFGWIIQGTSLAYLKNYDGTDMAVSGANASQLSGVYEVA